jgi:thiamine kinase-like enzyme
VEPLPGGMTNRNLLVTAPEGRFVVRIAGDNAVHDIDRRAEQAATRAAAQAGIAPELLWAEPDLLVMRHVDGHTLTDANLEDETILARAINILRDIFEKVPLFHSGSMRDRRPMTILAHYMQTLTFRDNRWRTAVRGHRALLSELAPRLAGLPSGFAHNDLHGGNLIDDGKRLWLVDWEYAGQGQPLADLASLVNNGLLTGDRAGMALELWLRRTASAQDRASFAAMRVATALRDLFWGYAQDCASQAADGDLDAYIAVNERRVQAAAARL